MKIRYDDNFAGKFGDDAVNTIRRIVTQVYTRASQSPIVKASDLEQK